MRFLATMMAVIGLAVAADTSTKPVQVIKTQIEHVANATSKLTAAISSFENVTQAVELLAANTDVLNTVNNGTQAILAIGQVELSDALLLTPPVLQLRALVNQSISAIISKKPIFANLSLGAITYNSLQQQDCASERFNNATNSRLPGGGIGAASAALSAPIFASFAMGLAAYQDLGSNATAAPNCTFVNGTSRGLAPADQSQSGAGLLSASGGMTFAVAAALTCFIMS